MPRILLARRAIIVVGVLAFSAVLGGEAESASPTLYVDVASTGGPCSDSRTAAQVTEGTPLCTLPRALALAAPGSLVRVRAGTYPSLTVTAAFTGRVTIAAFPSEQPVLAGAHLTATARNVRLEGLRITDITEVEGEYVELVGNDLSPHGIVLHGSHNLAEANYIHDLRIAFDENSTAPRCHRQWELSGENDQNGDGQYDYPLSQTGGIAPRCGYAFRVKGAEQVIRNNTVRKVPADGVQASETTNLLVEGNRFEDVTIQSSADGGDPLEHPDGAQVIGENVGATFRNNVFIDTRGILPMLGAGNRWPVNLRVENNVFYSTKDTGTGIGCIHASAVTGMTIVNNTCWGKGAYDPRVRITDGTPTTAEISETTGVDIRNNLIERYDTGGTVGVAEDYNLIRLYEAPGGVPGAHTLLTTPLFVAGDPLLHLAAGSPGIDAGTSTAAPPRDREGGERCDLASVANQGGGAEPFYDIGAHEFGSGSGSCLIAQRYADLVRSDGPRAYWRLGERAGTVAADAAGANHGSYTGGFVLGQAGALADDTAVRLNGTNGLVKVPDAPALDTGDVFSVEMWIKRARLKRAEGLATKGSYLIFLDAANYLNVRKPGTANLVRSTVPLADTTAFHHLVFTKSGPQMRLYLDGADRTAAGANRVIGNTTSPLQLGTGSGYFAGALDEVAVYPRALTSAEVAEHYAAR